MTCNCVKSCQNTACAQRAGRAEAPPLHLSDVPASFDVFCCRGGPQTPRASLPHRPRASPRLTSASAREVTCGTAHRGATRAFTRRSAGSEREVRAYSARIALHRS
eukprot:3713153-Pleurochrysis_carterae.AAC.1